MGGEIREKGDRGFLIKLWMSSKNKGGPEPMIFYGSNFRPVTGKE